jgi:hypothetical protein
MAPFDYRESSERGSCNHSSKYCRSAGCCCLLFPELLYLGEQARICRDRLECSLEVFFPPLSRLDDRQPLGPPGARSRLKIRRQSENDDVCIDHGYIASILTKHFEVNGQIAFHPPLTLPKMGLLVPKLEICTFFVLATQSQMGTPSIKPLLRQFSTYPVNRVIFGCHKAWCRYRAYRTACVRRFSSLKLPILYP